MAVVTFIDGGSTALSRYAAIQISNTAVCPGGSNGFVSCYGRPHSSALDLDKSHPSALLPARELIAAVKTAGRHHEHVVVDASGAPDQTLALVLAFSDYVITPLCLDEPNYDAFLNTIDLVRIVSGNTKQNIRHAIFLATRRHRASSATLLQVSALLLTKGISTLPVILCGWDSRLDPSHAQNGQFDQVDNAAFVYGFFDLVAREMTPIAKQQRFG